MKKLLLLVFAMAVSAAAWTQRIDVCKSDSVFLIRSGEGVVPVLRRGCDIIGMSDTTYRSLVLASIHADSLKAEVVRYMNVVKAEVALRELAENELVWYTAQSEASYLALEKRYDAASDIAKESLDENARLNAKVTKMKKNRFKLFAGGFIAGIVSTVIAVAAAVSL